MKYIKALAGIALLILLDQLTKNWAILALKDKEPFTLIEGVFQLQYLENTGVAFGLFKDQIIFVVIMTGAVIGLIAYFYGKIPSGKRFTPFRIIGLLLISGAMGNLIDRLIHNYVIDFFYFELIDFPIFNVADCYVVVSAILLVLLFLFYYKEEELDFLSFKKKEKELS